MYRTDKQFMKNPATASARIYVGSLAESVMADDLDKKFSEHGKILGLVLQRGFGFIQFENEEQAQSAINGEHGSVINGRKINVKQAIDNTKGKAQNFPNNQNNFQNNQNNFHNNQNNFQNKQNNFQNKPNNFQQNQKNFQPHNPTPVKNVEPSKPQVDSPKPTPAPVINPPPQKQPPKQPTPPQVKPPVFEPPPKEDLDSRNIRQKPPPRIPPPNEDMDSRNIRHNRIPPPKREFREDYREDIPPYYENPPPVYNNPVYPPVLDRPERNDCEIIVVAKALTEYAEYIEQRLKSLGLIVDLLFPNEDVPIGRVLANISSRGCLYAILIMPQNEEHRSLTLNILHGIPEEHRNMPGEDAFLLITRNFETYMRGEKDGPEPDKMTLTAKHPEHVQVLLNLLAENRQLNTGQYDRIMTYLQEKRDLQTQFEITEGIDTGIIPEAKTKQVELQSRIMNILNKKEDTPKVVEAAKPAPTPLLNDPSVQKALDSLLLGDMFKGLAS